MFRTSLMTEIESIAKSVIIIWQNYEQKYIGSFL